MRAGRMTAAQERGWKEGFPRFGLDVRSGLLDWEGTFSESGRRIVEIGFGMGDSLLEMALADPEAQFLGVEVHRPGVGRLLGQLVSARCSNVRIYAEDAVEVIERCLSPESIDAFHIFFPDPWHKKRHHKRRLVQVELVKKLASLLRSGGYIHLATDWEPYAEHMFDVLDAEPRLRNVMGTPRMPSPRPEYRPRTKFEARGERLGHGVWDLVYVRQ
jgi:tRNA (guanine-N7-)-methyltransferase